MAESLLVRKGGGGSKVSDVMSFTTTENIKAGDLVKVDYKPNSNITLGNVITLFENNSATNMVDNFQGHTMTLNKSTIIYAAQININSISRYRIAVVKYKYDTDSIELADTVIIDLFSPMNSISLARITDNLFIVAFSNQNVTRLRTYILNENNTLTLSANESLYSTSTASLTTDGISVAVNYTPLNHSANNEVFVGIAYRNTGSAENRITRGRVNVLTGAYTNLGDQQLRANVTGNNSGLKLYFLHHNVFTYYNYFPNLTSFERTFFQHRLSFNNTYLDTPLIDSQSSSAVSQGITGNLTYVQGWSLGTSKTAKIYLFQSNTTWSITEFSVSGNQKTFNATSTIGQAGASSCGVLVDNDHMLVFMNNSKQAVINTCPEESNEFNFNQSLFKTPINVSSVTGSSFGFHSAQFTLARGFNNGRTVIFGEQQTNPRKIVAFLVKATNVKKTINPTETIGYALKDANAGQTVQIANTQNIDII
jgi:hypothetical protein